MSEKGFVTEGTEEYFAERETRIKAQIVEHQEHVKVSMAAFEGLRAELTVTRDAVMAKTAELRTLKASLNGLSQEARAAAVDIATLAVQGETLLADLAVLLEGPTAHIAQLDKEIAGIESQVSAKTKGPKKEIEKLEAKLSRLRLRRTLAAKSQQASGGEDEAMMPVEGVHDAMLVASSKGV